MADIRLSDLTNGSIVQDADGDYVWAGSGVFDDLMEAVNGNIKVEYDNGRIVGPDYATVYLGAIQSVIAQSVQYILQEQATEAQIDKMLSDTAIAEAQSDKDLLIKDEQITKLQEEIDLLGTQDSELSLNGAKDRLVKDEQITKLQEEIDLLGTQDSELLLNGAADRLLKTAQTATETDKLSTSAKNRDVMTTQEALYNRQRAGFDDNKYQKILETQMNAWGITFQDTDTPFIPSQIGQTEFNTSFTAVRANYE